MLKDEFCNKCDIIIVTYNSSVDIQRCLRSIERYEKNVIRSIVIVDNNSNDDTLKILKDFSKNMKNISIIKNDINCGFSIANNMGFKQCKSDYVLFINPDTEFISPVISLLINEISDKPEVGVIGAQLICENGEIQTGFGKKPNTLSIIFDFLFSGKMNKLLPIKNKKKFSLGIRSVDWISGACILGRHSIIKLVGGFDENIFMYSEDVDLCLRIKDAGYKVLYDSNVEVIHVGGQSRMHNKEKALIANIHSRLFYANRYLGKIDQVILRCFFVGYLILRFFVSSLFKPHNNKYYESLNQYTKTVLTLIKKQKI